APLGRRQTFEDVKDHAIPMTRSAPALIPWRPALAGRPACNGSRVHASENALPRAGGSTSSAAPPPARSGCPYLERADRRLGPGVRLDQAAACVINDKLNAANALAPRSRFLHLKAPSGDRCAAPGA